MRQEKQNQRGDVETGTDLMGEVTQGPHLISNQALCGAAYFLFTETVFGIIKHRLKLLI